jgi:hypothetical protein
MNEKMHAFSISSDINTFLNALPKSVHWMQDEIINKIKEGKIEAREDKKGKYIGKEAIPYTDEEQLYIVIKTIRSYYVDLYKIYNEVTEMGLFQPITILREDGLIDEINVDDINDNYIVLLDKDTRHYA